MVVIRLFYYWLYSLPLMLRTLTFLLILVLPAIGFMFSTTSIHPTVAVLYVIYQLILIFGFIHYEDVFDN